MPYKDQAWGISRQLHPFPLWLCGWPLKPEVLLLLSPGPPCRATPQLPLHISLFWVTYEVDEHLSTGPQCPGTWSGDQ